MNSLRSFIGELRDPVRHTKTVGPASLRASLLSSALPALSSDGVGPSGSEAAQVAANGRRDVAVKPDVVEQIGESWRWLAYSRRHDGELRHAGREDHECPASAKRSGRREDTVEVSSRLVGDGLAERVVISGQILLRQAELITDGWIAEVQHVQVGDVDGAHAAQHFERGDTDVKEVAEQLRPRSLLLVGCVPRGSAAWPVVAATAQRRVGARREGMTRRALMPEASGELARRDRGDVIGAERQT